MKSIPPLLGLLGVVLIAGGLGHLSGVTRLYLTNGVPDMSRVLIDLWVGQAQLAGGAFYVAAYRAIRRGTPWQPLALAGVVIIVGWTSLAVPVLFLRAPLTFRIPATTYLIVSLWILFWLVRSHRAPAAAGR